MNHHRFFLLLVFLGPYTPSFLTQHLKCVLWFPLVVVHDNSSAIIYIRVSWNLSPSQSVGKCLLMAVDTGRREREETQNYSS